MLREYRPEELRTVATDLMTSARRLKTCADALVASGEESVTVNKSRRFEQSLDIVHHFAVLAEVGVRQLTRTNSNNGVNERV